MHFLGDVFCPRCGMRIELNLGCSMVRLLEAIRQQMANFGTEVWCSHCGGGHVVSRIELPPAPDDPVLLSEARRPSMVGPARHVSSK